MIYLLLIVGMIALIKGADLFVEGSSNIAKKLKVPAIIIGLTIVSLGTSLPEAAVSITASLNGSNELALSNITGSNIFNLMIVAGVCIILKPVTFSPQIIKRDFPVALAAGVLLLVFILDGVVGRVEAAIFLVACIVYILVLIKEASKNQRNNQEPIGKVAPVWRSSLLIVVGVSAIILGGDLVVDSAVGIARNFGLSETIIGLTIVAIGTSLPELVTSVVAAKKGESDLAMGNAVGSCILNILFIMGASSLISPIMVASDALFHVGFMLLSSALLFATILVRKTAGRKEGVLSVLVYAAYMLIVMMGQ